MPEVPVLVESLVDDAALFPPGNAPMGQALLDHVQRWDTDAGLIAGRFLCPASRLPELRTELARLVAADEAAAQQLDDRALALGLILDTGLADLPRLLDEVTDVPQLLLALVEIRPEWGSSQPLVNSVVAALTALPDVEGYVELPRREGWREALDAIADSPYGAKLRTGGARPDLFPTEQEVADFVVACVAAEVPFKCTAGLHRALRHRDEKTGFEHHGFLNLLCATAAATAGEGPAGVARVLADQDSEHISAAARDLDDVRAAVTRSFFVAYGSCDLREPWDDLLTLGLLP